MVGTLRFAHSTILYFTPVTLNAVFQISRCHRSVTGIFLPRIRPTGPRSRTPGAAPTGDGAAARDRAAAGGRSTRPASRRNCPEPARGRLS
jgi:hypothetical protein